MEEKEPAGWTFFFGQAAMMKWRQEYSVDGRFERGSQFGLVSENRPLVSSLFEYLLLPTWKIVGTIVVFTVCKVVYLIGK